MRPLTIVLLVALATAGAARADEQTPRPRRPAAIAPT